MNVVAAAAVGAVILSVWALSASAVGAAGLSPMEAERKYADLVGKDLYRHLSAFADISQQSRRDGELLWGRIAGTKYDKQSADYVKAQFEEAKLDQVWQETFREAEKRPALVWTRVQLVLIGGSSTAAPARDYEFITAMGTSPMKLTPPEGIEAPIVDVGAGSEEELARVDLSGKIALVHAAVAYMPYQHPGMAAIARIAKDGKAVGAVCALHRLFPSNDKVAITNGPGGATLSQINLGSGDGHFLSKVIKDSPADKPPRVRMTACGDLKTGWMTQNTFGLIQGTTDEYLLLQAHTDGYFEAAGDNGSGLAMLLGLAKHYAAQPRNTLRRNLLFVATAGHHSGPAVGTWHLIKNHLDILKKTVLSINLEHAATIGPDPRTAVFGEISHLFYDTHGHPFIRQALQEGAELFGTPINFAQTLSIYQADMYPYAVVGPTGLPSTMVMQPLYWYHTIEDDRDKISPKSLQNVTRLHAYLIDQLNGATVAEIRKGWKGHSPSNLNSALYKVLDLDLGKIQALDILK